MFLKFVSESYRRIRSKICPWVSELNFLKEQFRHQWNMIFKRIRDFYLITRGGGRGQWKIFLRADYYIIIFFLREFTTDFFQNWNEYGDTWGKGESCSIFQDFSDLKYDLQMNFENYGRWVEDFFFEPETLE